MISSEVYIGTFIAVMVINCWSCYCFYKSGYHKGQASRYEEIVKAETNETVMKRQLKDAKGQLLRNEGHFVANEEYEKTLRRENEALGNLIKQIVALVDEKFVDLEDEDLTNTD